MPGLDAALFESPALGELSKELAPSSSRPLEVLLPRLLPLHPGAKRPYHVGEKGFRWVHGDFANRAVGSFELRRWADRYPGCSWAIRTGALPGMSGLPLVAFDVDDLDHPDAPQVPLGAWVQLTPRGLHALVHVPHDVKTKKFGWGEIKGHNSYVVATGPGYQAAADFGASELGALSKADVEALGLEPVEAPGRRKGRRRAARPPVARPPLGQPEEPPDRLRNLVWRRPLYERQASLGRHGEQLAGRGDFVFYALLVAAGSNKELRSNVERLAGLAAWYNEGLAEPMDAARVHNIGTRVAGYSGRWEEHTAKFTKRQRSNAYRSHASRRRKAGHKERNRRIVVGRANGVTCSELARKHKLSERQVNRIVAAAPPRERAIIWQRKAPSPMPPPRRPHQLVWMPQEIDPGAGDNDGRDPPAGGIRDGET